MSRDEMRAKAMRAMNTPSGIVSVPATSLLLLLAEVEAFREAVRSGDGPSCEDVCLVECIGVCGVEP